MLEIIAGVDDDGEISGLHNAGKSERQLGAPDAAAERDNAASFSAHLNRSSSGERIRETAGDDSPCHGRPRTSTAGRASSACPMMREAAQATSSAKPVWVTRNGCPNRSGRPR